MKTKNKEVDNKKIKNKKVTSKKSKQKKSNVSKNNVKRNIREIELNPENIKIVKPEKTVNSNNHKKAASKAASKKKKSKAKKSTNPKVIILIKWTTIVFVLLGIAIFICTTPMFNVQEIQVSGNSKLTKNEIISLSQIKKNDNIFKYSKNKIADSIKENPYIKSVTIKKKYPNKVELIVEERKKQACVRILNSYAYIDNEGYILEISENREDLTIIEGIATSETDIQVGKRLLEEDVEKLLTAIKIVETAKNMEIGEELYTINIQEDEFVMRLENQKKLVYLGDATNLIYRIDAIKEALSKIPEKQGRLYADGDLNSGFELYFKEGEI